MAIDFGPFELDYDSEADRVELLAELGVKATASKVQRKPKKPRLATLAKRAKKVGARSITIDDVIYTFGDDTSSAMNPLDALLLPERGRHGTH